MAKPIVLNDDLIESMIKDFRDHLRGSKMADGKLTYTKNFEYKDDNSRICVMFTPSAYAKMITLLNHFETEVAWHGMVDRRSDKLFVIDDIVVYPQIVTGVTVTTDQEAYQRWTIEVNDEDFNRMRMQGHSHVNFSTSPSPTDLEHQEKILRQLNGDGYYIFLIFNKRLEHTIRVYDFPSNTLYEDKDIDVGIVGDDVNLDAFISNAKSMVQKQYNNYGTSVYKYPVQIGSDVQGEKPEKPTKNRRKKRASTTVEKNVEPPVVLHSGEYEQDQIDYDKFVFGERW